jgi:hypothetical protein
VTILQTFARNLAEAFYEDYPVKQGCLCDDRIKMKLLTGHWKGAVMRVAQLMGLGCPEKEQKRCDGTLYESPHSLRVLARLEWENKRLMVGRRRSPKPNREINELQKLARDSVQFQGQGCFCCYIGYIEQVKLCQGLNHIQDSWKGAASPLLLVLSQFELTRTPGYRDNKLGRGYRTVSFYEINPAGPVPDAPFLTQPWRRASSLRDSSALCPPGLP